MKNRVFKSSILVLFAALISFSLVQADPLTPTSLIEISATTSEEMQPAVAHSISSNTYLVAYEDDDHVKLRMYDSNGQPLSPSPYDLGSNSFWPSVAYNSLHDQFGVAYIHDQNIVVCWVNGGDQTPIACDDYYTGASETIMSTSIAFNNNDTCDDFMVVWQQGSLGDWSIYGHRFTPTSPYTPVGSRIDIALTTLTPGEDEAFSAPDITYNLNINEYLIVFEYWTSDASHTTGSDIKARRIRNDGSGPAPLPYIGIDIGECNQYQPSVAAYRLNTATPYFVAYEDDWNFDPMTQLVTCDSVTSIRGIYLEQDATLTNPAYVLNVSATYEVREVQPDISVSEALGSYVITWAKDSGTNMDIYARYLDVNMLTMITEPPTLISGSFVNTRNDETYPAIAAGNTNSMVVWQEDGWTGTTSDVIGAIWGFKVYVPMVLK